MKVIHKSEAKEFTLPLSIFENIHLADAVGRDGEEFDIFVGLQKKYLEQLKKFSSDKKDFEKNDTIFCLAHKRTDALACTVWFKPESFAEGGKNWHKIEWRSYPPFRRIGLMKNFAIYAMETYRKQIPSAKFWVKAPPEETASVKLAQSLDFEDKGEGIFTKNWG